MSQLSRSRLFVFIVALLCVLPVAAEVRLLTSIKPLQLIAAAVQDGAGTPDVLLPAGASAHDYALRPSDVRRLRDAQLFYWVGPELENFLVRPLAARSQPSVAVQQLPELVVRHFEHGDRDDVDHAHRHGSLDAHLWLLPANAERIAAQMASDLSRLDPAGAALYQTNLEAFRERLRILDSRLRVRLEPLRSKPFFVVHQAYDYFEAAYGLQHVAVFSMGGEVQPGVRHVAAMRQQLSAAGPACVFSEPPLRPRLAQTLTAGLPATLAELDPLGAGVTVNASGYETLLDNLADGLADCLEAL